MLLTGNDNVLMFHITKFLSTQFKIKALGVLSYFLGIQVITTKTSLFMSRTKYTIDILKEFAHLKSKTSCVPMDQHHDLMSSTNNPLLQDFIAHRRLVGRLIYLTISRPYLVYSVHILAQYMTAPRFIH